MTAIATEFALLAAAVWISGGTNAPESPAPALEKTFVLKNVPKTAELTLAVAGWHEISVNGRRVGNEVLSPVACQPDKRLSSVTREVAPFLKKGGNTVSILLGNGWYNCFTRDVWRFSEAPWVSAPMICGELRADGKTLFSTDGSWTAYDSPIVFNALRNGEWYDARKEGCRDNERSATVVADAPCIAVSTEDAPQCRAFDPIPPIRSFSTPDGGTIFDFGENRSGWCEIEVLGEAGAKVTIDYDESLSPSNTLLGAMAVYVRRMNEPRPFQHDEYTLAGRAEGERWHPRFTYHGFRYAHVRMTGQVLLKSIKSVFVHSDFKSAGSLEISDSVFAGLQDATRRSYLSNFVGIPTDCPHREKNGWTGDAQIATETGLWNFDAKDGYVHFLRMIIDAQRENGQVPCILPAAEFGYRRNAGPAWDAALFEIPWQIYRFHGDDAPAREAYEAMKKYLGFIGGKARKDGLVDFGIGDWFAPKGIKVAPVMLTASAYVYAFNSRVAFWAKRFGEPDVAEKCHAEAERVRAAFNKAFYRGGGVYSDGELTALAAPLYFKGLCVDGDEEKVAAELLRRVRGGRHLANFGILGAKWVPRVLSDFGFIDDAWRIFTQKERPGWAHWLESGHGTLKESWCDAKDSQNHIMFGDLSAWAFEYLAGIKIDEPGFAKFHVEPHLPDGVESFGISHNSPRGLLRVRAWREGGEPRYRIERRSAWIPREKGLHRTGAHRGGGKAKPENSLEAVLWCWGLGLAAEVDVRLTKDGVAIAMHDTNLKRIGRGLPPELSDRDVKDMTWDEIRNVDVGSYCGKEFSTTRIATFESILAAMKGRPERLLYVDEKGASPELLAKMAKQYGVLEQICFTTRFWDLASRWRAIAPNSRSMVWLHHPDRKNLARSEPFMKKGIEAMAATGFDGIDSVLILVRIDRSKPDPFIPSTRFLKDTISLLHEHGVVAKAQVDTWTEGKNRDVFRELWDIGFDCFMTDYPEEVSEIIKEFKACDAK